MAGQLEHISREQIQQRLASISGELVEQSVPKISTHISKPHTSPYIDAAAVLVFYDPENIQPLPSLDLSSETRNKYISELVSCSELIADSREYEEPITKDGSSNKIEGNKKQERRFKIHFRLREEVRKAALKNLVKEKRISVALQANEQLISSSKLPLQSLLKVALQNQPIELSALNLEELNALCQVADWLTGFENVTKLPLKKDILRRIEIMEMLAPFKHLTGSYVNGTFQVMFRGRQSELSILRRYVGVAPPRGVIENVERIFNSVSVPLFSADKKPLLIFGMGGLGKSTLLAKFILEHTEAQKNDRFPFVYLDFDRPHLSALEPETLLIEAARQLSIQYQDLSEISMEFKIFYDKWNQVYSILLDDSSTDTIRLNPSIFSKQKENNRKEIQSEFLMLIRRLASNIGSKPFLVVLDTFEEVQYKGMGYVNELYEFLKMLQDEYSMLRTVIAGRAPIHEFDTYRLELTDLDTEAAQGYLLKNGINDPNVAKKIALKIGGNPLTLKLAAELVKKQGEKKFNRIRTTQKQFGIFNSKLPELEIQGILYERILDHLHKPEIKKLAHPGMVLRRLTPDIILKVLAGPCALNIQNLPEAQTLFNEISREVALVTQPEPNVLRHRNDVRKVMLKLIKQSNKELVVQIHQLAVEYYRNKAGLVNRAEEFYHRLSLSESPRNLDKDWMEGMQNFLLGNLDELPVKAQAFILAKAGIESSDISIWESADMEDQNRRIAKQAANLLNSGHAEKALSLLNQNTIDKGAEVFSVLKVRAFSQLMRFDEAKETAKQTLTSYYSDQFAPAILMELRRFEAADTKHPPTTTDSKGEQFRDSYPNDETGNSDEMTFDV